MRNQQKRVPPASILTPGTPRFDLRLLLVAASGAAARSAAAFIGLCTHRIRRHRRKSQNENRKQLEFHGKSPLGCRAFHACAGIVRRRVAMGHTRRFRSGGRPSIERRRAQSRGLRSSREPQYTARAWPRARQAPQSEPARQSAAPAPSPRAGSSQPGKHMECNCDCLNPAGSRACAARSAWRCRRRARQSAACPPTPRTARSSAPTAHGYVANRSRDHLTPHFGRARVIFGTSASRSSSRRERRKIAQDKARTWGPRRKVLVCGWARRRSPGPRSQSVGSSRRERRKIAQDKVANLGSPATGPCRRGSRGDAVPGTDPNQSEAPVGSAGK